MDKSNLILTSTVGMPRETWLEFRKPLNHIKDFLDRMLRTRISNDVSREAFWHPEMRESIYPMLKEFFQSQAWKDFTFPCLGGSDVATVMGLNPYKSSIELYFEKIGAKPVFDIDNVAMFWGRELEEQIAEKWQYWDGNPEGLIENFKLDHKLRRCRRLNAYVQNKEYPWLYVSLDRVINKQKTDKETVDEGSLECKTISGYASDMWEAGIPVMYVAQLQAQLIACRFEYGEIAILKDGRYFDVFAFDRHPDICNRIIEMTKHFFDIVKQGAADFLLHSYSPNEERMQYHYAQCEQIAPEPDGSEAYKNYLSEKFNQPTAAGVLGTEVHCAHAKDYKYFAARIKEFEILQTERANKLKAFMGNASKLDLGPLGSCTWNENGKGSRTFRVNVRIDDTYKPESFQPDAVTENPKAPEADQVSDQPKKAERKVDTLPFDDTPKKKGKVSK